VHKELGHPWQQWYDKDVYFISSLFLWISALSSLKLLRNSFFWWKFLSLFPVNLLPVHPLVSSLSVLHVPASWSVNIFQMLFGAPKRFFNLSWWDGFVCKLTLFSARSQFLFVSSGLLWALSRSVSCVMDLCLSMESPPVRLVFHIGLIPESLYESSLWGSTTMPWDRPPVFRSCLFIWDIPEAPPVCFLFVRLLWILSHFQFILPNKFTLFLIIFL
jgi:hypothetical protein